MLFPAFILCTKRKQYIYKLQATNIHSQQHQSSKGPLLLTWQYRLEGEFAIFPIYNNINRRYLSHTTHNEHNLRILYLVRARHISIYICVCLCVCILLIYHIYYDNLCLSTFWSCSWWNTSLKTSIQVFAPRSNNYNSLSKKHQTKWVPRVEDITTVR